VLFRYAVQSMDPADITHSRQTYRLELSASVSLLDMNPTFSKTQTVTLVVNNGCALDEMTIVTGITDYTYYINENTEKGTWTQGVLPKPKNMQW